VLLFGGFFSLLWWIFEHLFDVIVNMSLKLSWAIVMEIIVLLYVLNRVLSLNFLMCAVNRWPFLRFSPFWHYTQISFPFLYTCLLRYLYSMCCLFQGLPFWILIMLLKHRLSAVLLVKVGSVHLFGAVVGAYCISRFALVIFLCPCIVLLFSTLPYV